MMKLSFDYDSIATIGNIYRVRAEQDSHIESPREWDNVATMVCHHRRYNLGDYKTGESDAIDAIDAIRASRDYRNTWEESDSEQFRFKGQTYDCFDLSNPSDVWHAMQLCSDIVCQPLYLYDHSGLSISTGGFSCPWDSGQVGFAFVTFETIRKEQSCKAVRAEHIEWARRMIDCETKTYDDYLSGQVYGWIAEIAIEWGNESYDCKTGKTESIPSEWEEIDSCWGYYGDFDKSGLAESALDSIMADIAERKALQAPAIPESLCELIAARKTLTGQARDILQRQITNIVAPIRLAKVQRRMVESIA